MTEDTIREILQQVAQGRMDVAQGMRQLRHLPFADLGFAKLDLHRKLRRGIPEVVFGEGKTAHQIAAIGERVTEAGQSLIVTRLDAVKARALRRKLKSLEYRAEAADRTCPESSAAAHRTRHRDGAERRHFRHVGRRGSRGMRRDVRQPGVEALRCRRRRTASPDRQPRPVGRRQRPYRSRGDGRRACRRWSPD